MKLRRQMAFCFADPKANRAAVLLVLTLGIVAFIRIRLLDVPLERDEGEFAYGGLTILRGLSPYKFAPQCHGPGTWAAYALAISLFGETSAAIRLGLIFVCLATALLVFFLTRRVCGNNAGLVAGATYALLSINPPTEGLAAHATHFVMLPALAGVLLLQPLDDDSSSGRVFWGGLLIGLAALMKQTGAAFGGFAVVWVVRCYLCSRVKSLPHLATRLGILAMGGLLPFIVTSCIVTLSGDWDHFVFWTFTYPALHSQVITFGQGIKSACGTGLELFKGAPGLWSLVGISPFLVWWGSGLPRWRFFILSFTFFSLLAVYPGWRPHYFIQLFPAAGLLVGAAFHAVGSLSGRLKAPLVASGISVTVFVAAAASTLVQWRAVYFTDTPAQVSRTMYGFNPFPEAVEVGDYLAAHCSKDGTIAVLGSEPEIYLYSHRYAATTYMCTSYMMETHAYASQMQKQMIREIAQCNPEYVVFVEIPTSWMRFSDSSTLITDWFTEYRRANLQLVGLVEMLPQGTVYHWLNNNDPPPQSSAKYWLAVYKRR